MACFDAVLMDGSPGGLGTEIFVAGVGLIGKGVWPAHGSVSIAPRLAKSAEVNMVIDDWIWRRCVRVLIVICHSGANTNT